MIVGIPSFGFVAPKLDLQPIMPQDTNPADVAAATAAAKTLATNEAAQEAAADAFLASPTTANLELLANAIAAVNSPGYIATSNDLFAALTGAATRLQNAADGSTTVNAAQAAAIAAGVQAAMGGTPFIAVSIPNAPASTSLVPAASNTSPQPTPQFAPPPQTPSTPWLLIIGGGVLTLGAAWLLLHHKPVSA